MSNPTTWLRDDAFSLSDPIAKRDAQRERERVSERDETEHAHAHAHTLHKRAQNNNKKNGSSSFEQTDDSFEKSIADSNNSSRGG